MRSRVWSPPMWLATLCLSFLTIPVRAATTLSVPSRASATSGTSTESSIQMGRIPVSGEG